MRGSSILRIGGGDVDGQGSVHILKGGGRPGGEALDRFDRHAKEFKHRLWRKYGGNLE